MRLKIERVKRGLNQQQLAEKCGVARFTISKIEKHGISNVKMSTLTKIAAALNSTVQELFF